MLGEVFLNFLSNERTKPISANVHKHNDLLKYS